MDMFRIWRLSDFFLKKATKFKFDKKQKRVLNLIFCLVNFVKVLISLSKMGRSLLAPKSPIVSLLWHVAVAAIKGRRNLGRCRGAIAPHQILGNTEAKPVTG